MFCDIFLGKDESPMDMGGIDTRPMQTTQCMFSTFFATTVHKLREGFKKKLGNFPYPQNPPPPIQTMFQNIKNN